MDEEIICSNPNCGYKGKPKKVERANLWTFIVLVLLGIWPGILYAVWKRGYEYRCPKCGMVIRSD